MYALITEPDGRVELSLQVPPDTLSASDARMLLRVLEPLVADLQAQVGTPPTQDRNGDRGPLPATGWSKPHRRSRTERARA